MSLFAGSVVFLVELGIGKVQLEVLRKHVTNKGGKLSSSASGNTTHIVTKLDYTKLTKHMKWTEWPDTPVYTVEWITETLRRGRRVNDTEFLVYAPKKSDGLISHFSSSQKKDTFSKPSGNISHSSPSHSSFKTTVISSTSDKKHLPSSGSSNATKTISKMANNITTTVTTTTKSTEKRQLSSINDSDDSLDISPSKRMKPFNWDVSAVKDNDSDEDVSRDHDNSGFDNSWLSYDSSEFDSKTDISLNDTVAMTPPSFKKVKSIKNDSFGDINDSHDKKHNPWDSPLGLLDESDISSPPLSPIGSLDDMSFSQYVKKDRTGNIDKTTTQKKKIDRRQFFVCQNSPMKDQKMNHNKDITDILQRLEETAESTGDKWRSYAYRKAATILKILPYKITSPDQLKAVKGIGNRISEKIKEIIETGKLRKAEVRDPMIDTMKLFSNVFGAGPETVKKWYALGYRTLQDVKNAPSLNHQQTIGIKYYQEFLQRITREEVTEIETKVKQIALSLDPEVRLATCGSYRRGKPDCGDIDILISQLHASPGFLKRLVDQLHQMKIITDDLTSSIVDKYMGVCRLNSNSIHRRIDLRLIPLPEWPCALLRYFTGSDHFNRSMRLWARKHGYSLNEHALVQRWGRLNRYEVKGEPLTVTTEEDVFRILGLDYREPKDRDV